MPEPGSRKYGTRRARLREDAEQSGVSGQDANAAAHEELQEGEGGAAVARAPSADAGPRASARRAPADLLRPRASLRTR
ncbi:MULTISPECIES: hypothetical protein [Streptomyces]|uniref:Uncharacterized protein n=1 Tax=Streptomyces fimbriatus TaxID=68197 RepID=A0ABW0D2G4_STRFI